MSKSAMQLLLALLLGCMAAGALAQVQTRAYAPENLRTLSVADQTRVIRLEYSEQSRGRSIPDDQLRFYLDQVNRSNWGFSRIKSDIAKSLSGGATPPPVGGQTLLCESKSHDARRCTPPWRGTSRLVRQISKSPCIEGQTWNSQDGLITVWNGCRGEFAPSHGAGAGGYSITCGSAGRVTTCAWNSRYGRPVLLQQLSASACREGSNWGYSAGKIWVGGGCRARFGVAGQGGNGYSVRCSSASVLPTWCGWNAQRGRPRLQQEFSARGRCVENASWGYSSARRQIWTRNGCSALFVPR